jgi:hypothetical protein
VLIAMMVVFGVRVTLAYTHPCTVHEVADDTAAQPAADERGCCPGEDAAEDAPADDEGCSCPIDCHQGCGGTALTALTPAVTAALRYLGDPRDLVTPPDEQSAPRASPHDILHVPRAT